MSYTFNSYMQNIFGGILIDTYRVIMMVRIDWQTKVALYIIH